VRLGHRRVVLLAEEVAQPGEAGRRVRDEIFVPEFEVRVGGQAARGPLSIASIQ